MTGHIALLSLLGLLLLLRTGAWIAIKLIPSSLQIISNEEILYSRAGREFSLEILIRNTSPLPLAPFKILLDFPGLPSPQSEITLLRLPSGGEQKVNFKIKALSRGLFDSGRIDLSGTDLLRYGSWQKSSPLKEKVFVYPPVKTMSRLDSPWQKEQEGPIHIVLNLSFPLYPLSGREEMIENAITRAASAAIYFLGRGREVSLICAGSLPDTPQDTTHSILRGRGNEQSRRILGFLALIQAQKERIGLPELLSLRENPRERKTSYYLITPPLLTEDKNFLFEQKRQFREVDYIYED
ncbi:MAG: hypothetical protein PQJ59_18135 [Spirochaetales bacterium]|nr:hypothetical protein [Spirochaetales bacterium]